VNAKLQIGKRVQKTADWEKSIKETKVRFGLQCHRIIIIIIIIIIITYTQTEKLQQIGQI